MTQYAIPAMRGGTSKAVFFRTADLPSDPVLRDRILLRVIGKIRFGHPSGILAVGAEAAEKNGKWNVTKVIVSRSARRLMTGQVFVPSSLKPQRNR